MLRELTDNQRSLLGCVPPGNPVSVVMCGVRTAWERGFLLMWLEHQMRCGAPMVARGDGALELMSTGQVEHVITPPGAAAALRPGAQRPRPADDAPAGPLPHRETGPACRSAADRDDCPLSAASRSTGHAPRTSWERAAHLYSDD